VLVDSGCGCGLHEWLHAPLGCECHRVSTFKPIASDLCLLRLSEVADITGTLFLGQVTSAGS